MAATATRLVRGSRSRQAARPAMRAGDRWRARKRCAWFLARRPGRGNHCARARALAWCQARRYSAHQRLVRRGGGSLLRPRPRARPSAMVTLIKRVLTTVLLLASAAAALAQGEVPDAARYSAAVATEWFRLILPAIQQTPGQSPPVAARTLAYIGLGLYESVVAGMPGQRSLAGQLNELESLPAAQPNEPLHWPTVANATLAALTRMLLPNAPADWMARFDALERNMPVAQSGDFNPVERSQEVIIRSETHGRLLAMALMTWARTDGGHDVLGARRVRLDAAYVSPSAPGAWVPTPPRFA